MSMSINEKLMRIQVELRAPKSQRNSFGGYNYRNCEDICEALKPLEEKYKVNVHFEDSLVLLADRVYVHSTAIFDDCESTLKKEDLPKGTGFAREPLAKKGMDESQITGAATSYARKYALGALFLIDDNKDADSYSPDYPPETEVTPPPAVTKIGVKMPERTKSRNELIATLEGLGVNLQAVANWKGVETEQLTDADIQDAINRKLAKNQKKVGGKAALDNLRA